jgi:hypothetical protein
MRVTNWSSRGLLDNSALTKIKLIRPLEKSRPGGRLRTRGAALQLLRDGFSVELVYFAAFHDELDALQLGDVRERIAAGGDKVRLAAFLDGADLILDSNQVRGVAGCR